MQNESLQSNGACLNSDHVAGGGCGLDYRIFIRAVDGRRDMMTKERLVEILFEAGFDPRKINFVLTNKVSCRRTGFIIDKLLPAVRDNEEFQQVFWEWMAKKDYAFLYDGIFYIADVTDGDVKPQMLEGYEKEYCLEILGKE